MSHTGQGEEVAILLRQIAAVAQYFSLRGIGKLGISDHSGFASVGRSGDGMYLVSWLMFRNTRLPPCCGWGGASSCALPGCCESGELLSVLESCELAESLKSFA